jgi:hypothetical protein
MYKYLDNLGYDVSHWQQMDWLYNIN